MNAERPSEPPSRLRRAWPHLRALLILVHLVAISLAALPRVSAPALTKSARQSPAARAEIAAWTERLASWGVEVEPEVLEQRSLELLEGWLELRTTLNSPFRPYIATFGLRQPWMLFPGADRFPAQLVIELEREGSWETVQTLYPTSGPWKARLARNTRVHGVVYSASWPVHRSHYDELGRWLAREAARDFPEATRLRLSIERGHMRSPEQVREGFVPEVRTHQARTFELESYR